MELFRLLGTVAIDNEGANAAIDETVGKAESSHSKIGSAFSKVGSAALKVGKTVAVGLAAGGAAVTALTKSAIDSYADYEQLVGGVETLFKDSGEAVMKYAENAYKTAGMSANEYMETVTSFSASLIQSLGGDTAAAAEKADKAITDMSDNANKMGSSMESIQNAYQGFAKQNFTMLDNLKLGYGGTQEEMKRLLSDAQAISGIEYDISSYADIVDAIHVIQSEMGITGTTAKEASATISGSISSMKSAWQNLVTGLGSEDADIGGLLEQFSESALTVADNVIPRIEVILGKIVELIPKIVPKITKALPKLIQSLLPTIINAATALIQSLANALPSILGALMDVLPIFLDGVMQIFEAIVGALPQLMEMLCAALPTLIPALIDGLVSMIITLATKLPEIIQPIIDNLPTILISIVDALVSNVPLLIDAAVQMVGSLIAAIPEIIAGLIEALPSILSSIGEGLVAAGGVIVDAFKGVFNTAKEAIGGKLDEIKGQVEEHGGGIKGFLGMVGENTKTAWTNVFNKMDEITGGKMSAMKQKIEENGGGIKGVFKTVTDTTKQAWSTAFNKMDEITGGKLTEIKNKMSEKLTAAKDTVVGIFEKIKSGITDKITMAKDVISGIVDKIKGIFNFDFKLPKIKMPHFGITPEGWKIGDLLDGVIPKLGIEWYAKGGVMEKPTVFGRNGNNAMVGGEAGAEAIAPISTLQNYIREAVAEQNASNYGVMREAFTDALREVLPDMQEIVKVVPDETGVFRVVRDKAREYTQKTGNPAFA